MRLEDDININYPVSGGLFDTSIRALKDYINTRDAEIDKIIAEDTTETKSSNDGLVRPNADYYFNYGEDGRDPSGYVIRYRCPSCNKVIRENDIGCVNCRIFFDWSKKAKVKTGTALVWE